MFYSVVNFLLNRHNRHLNTLRPRQNGRHFADDTFKPIFLNENIQISIKISLKFVPKEPVNNIPALVQIMAWRRPGDKPLSETMMIISLTHICVTRPQWVKAWPWDTQIRPRAHNRVNRHSGHTSSSQVSYGVSNVIILKRTDHKNIERQTAHNIVSWPKPKQWVIVHTSDLMMIIRQSIYILSMS